MTVIDTWVVHHPGRPLASKYWTSSLILPSLLGVNVTIGLIGSLLDKSKRVGKNLVSPLSLYMLPPSWGVSVIRLLVSDTITFVAATDASQPNNSTIDQLRECLLPFIRDAEKSFINNTVWYLVGGICLFALRTQLALRAAILLSWANTVASALDQLFGHLSPRRPDRPLRTQILTHKSLLGVIGSFVTGAVTITTFSGSCARVVSKESSGAVWQCSYPGIRGWLGIGVLGIGAGVVASVFFDARWESFQTRLLSPAREHDAIVDSDYKTSSLPEASPPPEVQPLTPPTDPWANAPFPPLDQSRLFAQEVVHEPIIIPAGFTTKYLWPPSALATKPSNNSTSPPGAYRTNHMIIPPALLGDANDALSAALSMSTQLTSVHPKSPPPPPPLSLPPPLPMSPPLPLSPPLPPPIPLPANVEWSPPQSTRLGRMRPPRSHVLTESIVTLFAPFNNAASVIDALVSGVGESQQADVLVIDALTLAEGEAGPLGPGIESFLKDLYRVGDYTNEFLRPHKLQRYLQALINVQVGVPQSIDTTLDTDGEPKPSGEGNPFEAGALLSPISIDSKDPELEKVPPDGGLVSDLNRESALEGKSEIVDAQNDEKPPGVSAHPPRPRIIYIRDFGAIASRSKEFIRELILAVRARRVALQSNSDFTVPYDAARIQSTAIILGVSYSPEDPPHARSSSRTWEKFEEGFEAFDTEDLCRLLPDILDHPLSEDFNDDGAGVLADALSTAPDRVRHPERTWYDPDTGSGAVYRQIICAYGFSDSRDPFVRSRKGGKRVMKPDVDLWRKGFSMAQKEREEELGMMRLTRNDHMVRKALSARGCRVPEGVGVFSALPEEDKLESEDEKRAIQGKGRLMDPKQDNRMLLKRKKKGKEELEEEPTVAVFKEVFLTRTMADRIAAFALRGPVTPGSLTLKAESSADQTSALTLMETAATNEASTIPARVVYPQELADAIKAIVVDLYQREEWLNDYKGLRKQDNLLDSNINDNSDEKGNNRDLILAKVRDSGELNPYEERLLGGVIDTTQLTTSFEDVCVDPKIVDGLRSIISLPLMYPKAFASGILGTEALSGILLYGPPGTGKTMLCRAVAKECNVRMLLVSPSAVQDMYIGETEKLVKAVFTLARKIAPCVIFIDEVDAIFGSRSSGDSNGSQYHRSMLTEFMTEMDGLNSASMNKKKGLVVIGATNRPFDLDDAILRRLPRRMLVDLPGLREREQILKTHLKSETMEGVDLSDLARRTNNFSGSDLKNLVVSAALTSLKEIIPYTWNVPKVVKTEADKANSDQENEGETDGSDTASESRSDKDEPIAAPRILRPIHFHAAFEQVSATSSRDMSSVQRLRTWAAQFSRDSGPGFGAPFKPSPPSALAKGYTHLGIPPTPKVTLTPKDIGADAVVPGISTPAAHQTNSNGGVVWNAQYEANILSRFANRPGLGDRIEGAGTSGSGSN